MIEAQPCVIQCEIEAVKTSVKLLKTLESERNLQFAT